MSLAELILKDIRIYAWYRIMWKAIEAKDFKLINELLKNQING